MNAFLDTDVGFYVQPTSKNASTNQEVKFFCLPFKETMFVAWIICSQFTPNGNVTCINAHLVEENDCPTIVKPGICMLDRDLHWLKIVIKDNCLLNELNNSIIPW